MAAAASLLDDDNAAFIQRGVSIHLASRGSANVPSIARAVGCKVSADRRRVTLFVPASQAGALLDDIRATGTVAAVFSEPSTHRTIQLKATHAVLAPVAKADLQLIEAYRNAFVADLASWGFAEAAIRTLLACSPADLVAVAFTPTAAFEQTPGPSAGTPLKRG
jgi:hypothetical protein